MYTIVMHGIQNVAQHVRFKEKEQLFRYRA